FTVRGATGEELAVVLELDATHLHDAPSLATAVREAVGDAFELAVQHIAFVKTGALFLTSSGKVQRYACRDALVASTLDTAWRDSLNDQNVRPSTLELDARPATATEAPSVMSPSAVERALCEAAARCLSIPVEQVDPLQSLIGIGVDSLRAH